jgi:hypothetical protein
MESLKCAVGEDCVVLELGDLGEWIGNIWRILKCGAGEGWKRSVGSIV